MSNRREDFQAFLDAMRDGLQLIEPLRPHHTGVALLELAIKGAQAELDRGPFDPTIALAACAPAKMIWDKLLADYYKWRAIRGLSNAN